MQSLQTVVLFVAFAPIKSTKRDYKSQQMDCMYLKSGNKHLCNIPSPVSSVYGSLELLEILDLNKSLAMLSSLLLTLYDTFHVTLTLS